MLGKGDTVVSDVVEAVSSSNLLRTVWVVLVRLCAFSKCEVMDVDMTSPND